MKLLAIGEAAKLLGVSCRTLRRWGKSGKVKVVWTAGGHRRFDQEELLSLSSKPKVSSQAKPHDPAANLLAMLAAKNTKFATRGKQ